MGSNVVNQPNYFGRHLRNVKNEAVNIPEKIQGHGFLIAVTDSGFIITHLSENLVFILSEDPRNYLGKQLSELVGKLKLKANGEVVQLDRILSSGMKDNELEYINPYLLEVGLQPYNLIVHHSGEYIVLEFENVLALTFDFQNAIEISTSGELAGKVVAVVLEKAVGRIKKIIGYDRVMVCKFDKNGFGQVIVEARGAGMESRLGSQYPPSRISRQAAELYKRNLSHIISDTDCIESAIIAFNINKTPLELSQAVLRTVSPDHMQYLKNASIASGFDLSLISNGELLGLIACHNYTSRFINYRERATAGVIAREVSSSVDLRVLNLQMLNYG